ncbi:hypothetical protein COT72_00220 [archaeon CG10_big_fil_rev_8_21_14_0_10_43_11]|nr:MAG: hypothetical protein COT72_00220 [archaeon CG10_big_fil_rev_8_21_14_0_10_43_11]
MFEFVREWKKQYALEVDTHSANRSLLCHCTQEQELVSLLEPLVLEGVSIQKTETSLEIPLAYVSASRPLKCAGADMVLDVYGGLVYHSLSDRQWCSVF